MWELAQQQLKEELGLDHFEGRSWRGLHRHTLMTLIAYLFLQHLRLQAANGGKKKSRRTTATTDPSSYSAQVACSSGARHASAMSHLPSSLHPLFNERSAKVLLVGHDKELASLLEGRQVGVMLPA